MPLMGQVLYRFGPFLLDPAERLISHDGIPLTVTLKVFHTLLCLVRNYGRVLTKDELLKQIWPDRFVEEVSLAVNISVLRKAFGKSPQGCRYIATAPGRGYRFIAQVRGEGGGPLTTGEENTVSVDRSTQTAIATRVLTFIRRVKSFPDPTESAKGSRAPVESAATDQAVKLAIRLMILLVSAVP